MSEKKGATNAGVPRGDKRSDLRKVPIRLSYSSDEDSDYNSEAEGCHVNINIKMKINPNFKDNKVNLIFASWVPGESLPSSIES